MSYTDASKNGLRPDPNINFLEWANRFFYLPRESTAEYGRYRSSRTPMVEEILLELSPESPTQEVVVMKPTQLAGTTAAIIFMLASMDIAPGPGLCIEPTGDLARSFSKKKFQTAIDSTITGSGRLAGKIDENRSTKTSNTILEKTFPGGSWRLAGSNSPAVYRGESVRYMVLDDFDGFEADIGGEGDPGELADRRTGTFPNRKIYKNSTPTLKDFSNIERAYKKSSQGRFNVPCPHCGEYQYLIFANLKFKRNEDGQVVECWYECEHCHQRIDEHHKNYMIGNGKYIHRFPERKIRGFQYNALVTPLGWINSWSAIAQSFLDSKNNAEKLQVWTNTLMAEPFEQKGVQPKWESLLSRCEPYKMLTVPAGGYILTAGVDVQDNRLAIRIDAWGEGEENWCIFWAELYGDPGQDELWEQLDQIINRPFEAPHIGTHLHIVSVGVDTGGHHTQRVYDYCRRRMPRVFALKGANVRNKPIIGRPTTQDVSWNGQTIKGGVQLWPIGTDTAKALIYNRFGINKPGPGYFHFYIGLEEDFFKQLTAEKLSTRFIKGYPIQEWVKLPGRRNEALDCTVYSYAAALRAGLKMADWAEIKANAEPRKIVRKKQKEPPRTESRITYKRPDWLNR